MPDDSAAHPPSAPPLAPAPEPPRSDTVELHHGVEVPDPFRPLEELEAPATRAWVEAHRERARAFLDALPGREAWRRRLLELWSDDRPSTPYAEGGRVFFTRGRGLADQDELVVADGPDAEPRVLIDPSELSDDGTVSLAGWSPSRDGRLLAYGLSDGGSDWTEWRVREVDTGRDRPDRVRRVKFSGATWLPDGSGFLYGRYDAAAGVGADGEEGFQARNENQRLFLHRLGRPQEEDELVLERPDEPTWGFGPWISHDGRWLVVTVWRGAADENAVWVRRLDAAGEPFRELLPDFDALRQVAGSDGDELFLLTDEEAPLGRVVRVSLAGEGPAAVETLVPEGEAVLEQARRVGDRLVVSELKDARSRVRVHTLDGRFDHEVALPEAGTAAGFWGTPEESTTWFSFSSFTRPRSIHLHDVATGRTEERMRTKAPFEPEDFETTQHFVESPDGTRVPVFLSRRKGLEPDGRRPVLLYGYGGFLSPLTPAYSRAFLAFIERGGVLATANLRGGGEYGKAWHEAGRRLAKQNVFDDCLAVAQWLIESGWTARGRLAVHGRSNGGLLAAAVLTQRPELWGAALPHVGVHDMLRYHLATIGWAWTSDYGSVEDPEEFRALHAYSPYHRVEPGTAYPPTLVTTADHDDRVVPWHSYKLAAALCEAQAGEAPVLLSVTTRAGHGGGTPTSVQVEESADQLAFLEWALRMEPARG